MVVHDGDLGGRDTGVLEFEGGAFLAADDDDVFAFYADCAGSCCYGVVLCELFVIEREGSVCSVPLLTASMAYSTWKTCPSGLYGLLDNYTPAL